jgi:hypothetical protein
MGTRQLIDDASFDKLSDGGPRDMMMHSSRILKLGSQKMPALADQTDEHAFLDDPFELRRLLQMAPLAKPWASSQPTCSRDAGRIEQPLPGVYPRPLGEVDSTCQSEEPIDYFLEWPRCENTLIGDD